MARGGAIGHKAEIANEHYMVNLFLALGGGFDAKYCAEARAARTAAAFLRKAYGPDAAILITAFRFLCAGSAWRMVGVGL